ncbi:Guanine nucleotide-binding protein subunit alpha [Grifola frondosa]|uniref:Guanine nucleotide-binding protein subunit alpha n=1 Tax=Grifola frondosa TaxID=5627 RepID=A0A1C7MLZ9_GRIFR|nr:Guanine nucleotide-binding protein subunit alpha [Grifola frondosa]
MPSNTSLSTPVTPKKVLSVIHNIPKRMKSAQFQTPRRARGKENVPQGMQNPPPGTCAPTKGPNDDKWAPKDGMTIIKIWVPSTADIWKMKVPEAVALDDFLLRVERKVGFAVTFSALAKLNKLSKAVTRPAVRMLPVVSEACKSYMISRHGVEHLDKSTASHENFSSTTEALSLEAQGKGEAELEAKRISDAIDEELQRQAKAEKRGPKPIKLLLLGQSESGKSTTLKNFQLMNSPKAFRAERASWRAVIQLNVVRSIRIILDVMSDAQAFANSPPSSFSDSSDSSHGELLPTLSAEHLKLRMRLSPLAQVERALIRKLTPDGSGEYEATQLVNPSHTDRMRVVGKEVAVNSQFPWKGVFNRLASTVRGSFDGDGIDWDDPDDPAHVLHACLDDITTLWNDPTIKQLLEAQRVRLEDMPGFFLDSLPRVTSLRYVPTDDDILRARLKTLGVTEHRFTIREGMAGPSRNLRIYDVGGQRSLRAAWAPFFDDVNAIIFLAPMSAFDQVLAEDENVNRVEDSVLLWKSICSNQLLGKTNMILFLNKVDIFMAKLKAGIQFGKFIISYGNRPNDYESTSMYLRRKFGQIHKEFSPQARTFYCHFTSVTDTKSTATILADVQDTILMANLKSLRMTT